MLAPRQLSPRQEQVVNLIALGWPDKQIAAELAISEETVAWHLRQLFAHFKVHSRAALVRVVAVEDGAALGMTYTNV